MLPLGLPAGMASPDPLVILLLALAVDAVLGEMPALFRFVPHPVKLIGGLVAAGESRLNRDKRSERDRRLRGVLFCLAMIAGAFAVGWAIAWLGRVFRHAWLLELFLVAVLIAQRSLYDHVGAVAVALERGGLGAGREAVSRIVGRDPASLDEHGVARAAIESCAENFSDAVVAPVFWYLLLGLPGLLAYKTANTLDSMIGHKSERFRAFGWASARFDDLVNLVPARLAGLLLALAALFTPRAHPWRAFRVMLRDAGKHRSPNAGWPEAAAAGALDLSLAGPRRYPGVVVSDPWIGDGRARATARDVARALQLFVAACLLDAALVAVLLWVRQAGWPAWGLGT